MDRISEIITGHEHESRSGGVLQYFKNPHYSPTPSNFTVYPLSRRFIPLLPGSLSLSHGYSLPRYPRDDRVTGGRIPDYRATRMKIATACN